MTLLAALTQLQRLSVQDMDLPGVSARDISSLIVGKQLRSVFLDTDALLHSLTDVFGAGFQAPVLRELSLYTF